MTCPSGFAGLLESFFTDRLMRQRQASRHTIASYRDTFRLLLGFAKDRLGKAPSTLAVEDLDAPFLGAFLDHIESHRKNSARTRNARLAAIHSFFRYAALREPAQSALIQRVLAIPNKRHDRRLISFLTHPEIEALLKAPDHSSWIGRRDRTLLLVAVQTGLRVSELVGLRGESVVLGTGAHVRCEGKGRKERCTPLRKETVASLRAWIRERAGTPLDPLFPSVRGHALSRDAVERLIAKHAATAGRKCPSFRKKHVSPHVLRHTAAMDLLQHGVDRTVIALWLGHESIETTQMYLQADLAMKEKAMAKTTPTGVRPGRYRPTDRVLAFLQAL